MHIRQEVEPQSPCVHERAARVGSNRAVALPKLNEGLRVLREPARAAKVPALRHTTGKSRLVSGVREQSCRLQKENLLERYVNGWFPLAPQAHHYGW